QTPSELARYPIDLGTQAVKADRLVAWRAPDPGGRAVLAEAFAQDEAPFAGGNAGFGADDGGGHDVAVLACRRAQLLERRRDRPLVARATPRLEALDLLGFGPRRDREDGVGRAGERRGLALDEAIDSHHDPLAPFDRLDATCVRFHELLFHIAVLPRGNRPAERFDMRQLFLSLALEPLDLFGDRRRAVENI